MIKLSIKPLFWLVIFSGITASTNVLPKAVASSATTSNSANRSLYEEGFKNFESQSYRQAIAKFLALLETEPNNHQAYNMIGMSFGQLEEYTAAIAAFDKAIALDADFANAYYNRGYAYKELGQLDSALSDFDRTLELQAGEHISALINRATIYALRENYPAAVADLTQVVKLKPDEANAYYNRAIINLTTGNKIAYLEDLATAEELYLQIGDRVGLEQIEKVRELYE